MEIIETCGPYRYSRLREGIWQIEEYGVYCYLIEGNFRALLIDTGTGFGDLAGLVKKLTDKPVIAAATHAHPDHIGGRGNFPSLYLPAPDRRMAKFYGSLFARRLLFTKGAEQRYGVSKKSIKKGPLRTKYIPIGEGQVFDLGGRTVRTEVTSGHTKGSTIFLLEEEKIIFTGDSVCRGVWLFLPGTTTVEAWLTGAERILALEAEYEAYGGHEAAPQDPALLSRLVAAAKELVKTHKNTFFPKVRIYPKEYVDCAVVYRTTRIKNKAGKSR